MNKIIGFLFVIYLMSFQISAGADFGEYQYSEYLGIQQQLQNQRAMALRRQMKYNTSPTRNIKYPRTYNSYPNIEKSQTYKPITRNQRYSSAYYQGKYNR